jgi:hypothetical protein
MAIDVDQLVLEIKNAASQILNKDVSTIRGFSERQLKAIAQQAALVAAGIASGQITDETKDFFLDSLEDMARNYLNTLRGLTTVTIEKIWNAAVTVIWKAISTATGIALPLPLPV